VNNEKMKIAVVLRLEPAGKEPEDVITVYDEVDPNEPVDPAFIASMAGQLVKHVLETVEKAAEETQVQ
jgi:hypothetical protein